jgi:ethanolamine ammonia-lyase small subunit
MEMTQTLSFWKKWTQARIGLGKVGHSIPTQELLNFKWAHAAARDAVLRNWKIESSRQALQEIQITSEILTSQAKSREEFLRRPDLGRALSLESRSHLQQSYSQSSFDLCLIASDGLSAFAIEEHLLGILTSLHENLRGLSFRVSPVFLVPYGRVAISDEIGALTHSKLSIIMIGERPGLSAPNSMGIYLTYAPHIGNADSLRNCLSNIRPPHGLSYEEASRKLTFLIRESLRLKLSGVNLKESDSLLPG